MSDHFLTNAKAYAALIGSVVSALLGLYGPDTTVGHALTVAAVVCTTITTWKVPNQPASGKHVKVEQ